MSILHDLTAQGQSVWLSFLRRSFIQRGQLRQLVEAGIRGIVLEPAIVERALSYSADYDERLQWHLSHGKSPQQTVEAILVDDVQRAADVLQGVYDVSDHGDGFVVLPLDPHAAHNTVSRATTVAVRLRAVPNSPGGAPDHPGAILWVSDDGRGFDLPAALAGATFGLKNMRDRLAAVGGTIRFDSAPGTGTRVVARIPPRRRPRRAR